MKKNPTATDLHEVNMALSAIYRLRIRTDADQWTTEQRQLILHVEHDLVELRDSMKAAA